MNPLNFKGQASGELDEVINRVTDRLKNVGFGILTRIDFHLKIKEKLGKDIAPTVVLGACNPQVAYEAFKINTDVTSLIPCNVVVRELAPKKYSVEITSPSTMLALLPGAEGLCKEAEKLDKALKSVLQSL